MLKIASALFVLASLGFAQEQFNTQTPADARYEIKHLTTQMLRLDKYTGQIARMQSTPDGMIWEEMPVEGLPPTASTGPRFQLSTWADASAHLLDTATGQTWKLSYAIGKDGLNGLNVWKPFRN